MALLAGLGRAGQQLQVVAAGVEEVEPAAVPSVVDLAGEFVSGSAKNSRPAARTLANAASNTSSGTRNA